MIQDSPPGSPRFLLIGLQDVVIMILCAWLGGNALLLHTLTDKPMQADTWFLIAQSGEPRGAPINAFSALHGSGPDD